jgi:hypothetical protein
MYRFAASSQFVNLTFDSSYLSLCNIHICQFLNCLLMYSEFVQAVKKSISIVSCRTSVIVYYSKY